jgi:dolichol-phosphate mannosyltransferase
MFASSERILLFIPMYNCERQIGRVVGQLTPEVSTFFEEALIVDNRSQDGSQQAAADALKSLTKIRGKLLVNNENYGLGGSHKVAFEYALANGFDYCAVLHGDDQGRVTDVVSLLAQGAHREVDCLLGARFMRNSQLEGYSGFRTIGNRAFNFLYSLVSRRRIYDLGAGLNLYSVKALSDRKYLRHADDLTFNYHMILQSIDDGWRIRFFPILWREADQVSNVKLFRQAWKVLRIALEYAFNRKSFRTKDFSVRPRREYAGTVLFDTAVPAGPVVGRPGI